MPNARLNSFHRITGLNINERLQEIEDPRALHIREPNKYKLPFFRNAWGALNHRRAQELEESANILRLRARVEGPTYDQLKAIGAAIGPADKKNISQIPSMPQLRDSSGYFPAENVRKWMMGRNWLTVNSTATHHRVIITIEQEPALNRLNSPAHR